MATGACGIDCGACRLNRDGHCTTCGSGVSAEGKRKAATQEHLLGQPCPILACAGLNQVAYCLCDCDQFPCDNFSQGPYPFAKGFLEMQQRRRKQTDEQPKDAYGTVPEAHWESIAEYNMDDLVRRAWAIPSPDHKIELVSLDRSLIVDIKRRRIQIRSDAGLQPVDAALAMMTAVYLKDVQENGLSGQLLGIHDLKDAHFFQGPHDLPLTPLVDRFGRDPQGFQAAARKLGGSSVAMADSAVRLWIFPKVPVLYLLWQADHDFRATLSILLDRSIETHLAADAIWGMLNLTSDALLSAADDNRAD